MVWSASEGASYYVITAYDAFSGRSLGIVHKTRLPHIDVPGLPSSQTVRLEVQVKEGEGMRGVSTRLPAWQRARQGRPVQAEAISRNRLQSPATAPAPCSCISQAVSREGLYSLPATALIESPLPPGSSTLYGGEWALINASASGTATMQKNRLAGCGFVAQPPEPRLGTAPLKDQACVCGSPGPCAAPDRRCPAQLPLPPRCSFLPFAGTFSPYAGLNPLMPSWFSILYPIGARAAGTTRGIAREGAAGPPTPPDTKSRGPSESGQPPDMP